MRNEWWAEVTLTGSCRWAYGARFGKYNLVVASQYIPNRGCGADMWRWRWRRSRPWCDASLAGPTAFYSVTT